MITVRIVCQYCGMMNHLPIPLVDYKKTKTFGCGGCEAFLFEIIDEKEDVE